MCLRKHRDTARQLISRWTEDARKLELRPELDEPPHAEHGVSEVCGEEARVDRANARPAQDVDLRRRAQDARQIVEHVPEHAHLVRPACSAS
jgi:hypothetical protein